MKYEERVPDSLFQTDGHYLGRPADFDDRIVQRRLRLIHQIPGFTGKEYSLLDIGCGNGASIIGLSPYMKRCLGIDINDEHMAEFNHFKEKNKIENCEYQVLDIEKNLPPDTFDRIVSFEVIEHLNQEDGLAFYYKALKNKGKIAISVPNKWWIFETHGAKLPLLPWNRVPFFSWLPRKIHEKYANARIYTKKRIVKLLVKHGFIVVSVSYITAPMDVLPNGKFKNFIIKHFFDSDTTNIPCKSTSIFVVAEKR
ncbi:MAG: class I SAM-dependent methyltransferase [Bacteroidales bacterium]|jgi:SAM-dependent methyltransferase|nr:class I SAM-dependent methyltransferase [Bacteroidales bacterium]MDD2686975.1 class I SAM-dependent methyltransferase [Bacteroidales bacterium]MDD3330288.1 class I SAM-dependent methyltransferase [Bacteroidales bacterium]MDD3690980.1 class I SAM-dependent methyltransferase [Bacteroidales bacterium]MDD4044353.1 class I SAM-dependent methyltransferase [Bacteroidales bacterium]